MKGTSLTYIIHMLTVFRHGTKYLHPKIHLFILRSTKTSHPTAASLRRFPRCSSHGFAPGHGKGGRSLRTIRIFYILSANHFMWVAKLQEISLNSWPQKTKNCGSLPEIRYTGHHVSCFDCMLKTWWVMPEAVTKRENPKSGEANKTRWDRV